MNERASGGGTLHQGKAGKKAIVESWLWQLHSSTITGSIVAAITPITNNVVCSGPNSLPL